VKVSALMLAAVLVQFYRGAGAMFISPATYAGELSYFVGACTVARLASRLWGCDRRSRPRGGTARGCRGRRTSGCRWHQAAAHDVAAV